jgi:hypothetical protein
MGSMGVTGEECRLGNIKQLKKNAVVKSDEHE